MPLGKLITIWDAVIAKTLEIYVNVLQVAAF